jgi:hypothetical protein
MSEDIPLRHPVNTLVSFHYFEKIDIGEMNGWGLRLIGDSGAFSALSQGTPIDIAAFCDWATRWKESLSWVASLDVIGDAEASWNNYRYLRDRGVDAVPTIHYGEAPELISRYATEGIDFMGLGGMVGRKSEPQRLLRWTLSMFRYARKHHPDMRFHGWGVTHPGLVMNLPWFSVDSSGFSSAYRFGRLSLFNPSKAKTVGIDLNGKDIWKHSDLVRGTYRVDPGKVAVSDRTTRRDLVRLSVASVQKMEEYLQRRHNVSAPTYGIQPDPSPGPRVHAAVGFPGSQATLGISPTDTAPRELQGSAPSIGSKDQRLVSAPRIHAIPGTHVKDFQPLKEKP